MTHNLLIYIVISLLIYTLSSGLLNAEMKRDIIAEGSTFLPSADDVNNEQFTKQQDSNFTRDSSLSGWFFYLFKKGFARTDAIWSDILKSYDKSISEHLSASFAKMPANIFEPLEAEVVQYQLTKTNALSIPTVHRLFPDEGMQFNLHDIGLFLGIVEDVSPKITYSLSILADVQIAIYSVSATEIATIFSGTQKPGKYTIYWNGKDLAGKQMPAGDYIAEVKVGQSRFVRKRIVIE